MTRTRLSLLLVTWALMAPAMAQTVTPAQRAERCRVARREARYRLFFDRIEVFKLVQLVADATCKTFVMPEGTRGEISIVGPEHGPDTGNADQLFAIFRAALDAHGLGVSEVADVVRIVPKAKARLSTTVVSGSDDAQRAQERKVSWVYRPRNAEVEPLRALVERLVSPEGEVVAFGGELLVVTDVGSAIAQLESMVLKLDVSADRLRVFHIRHAVASALSEKVQRLFEGNKKGAPGKSGASDAGRAVLHAVMADDRTNKLIATGTPSALDAVEALIAELDIPSGDSGELRIYRLRHAKAKELVTSLQSLTQGAPGAPKSLALPGGEAGSTLRGDVRFSAHESTNALMVTASASDHRSLAKIIDQLDVPRRQVYIETLILEVDQSHARELGANFHVGGAASTAAGPMIGVAGVQLPMATSSLSLADLPSKLGLLVGIQGPALPPAFEALGLNASQLGLAVRALEKNSNVHVLSQPNILTVDNEEAEITVGQKVPFRTGYVPPAANAIAAGRGFDPSSFIANIQRERVELKLIVRPHVADGETVHLEINQQAEELAPGDPELGPTTTLRGEKTHVVARDRQTLVLGGILQERTTETVAKVPVLGDIPILGHFFRSTEKVKAKMNLLIFLTPYIIHGQDDLDRIAERRMAERTRLLERLYGSIPESDLEPKLGSKRGPLRSMLNALDEESRRAENGGPGLEGERVVHPTPPESQAAPPHAPASP
jgi:general secretion pathway protein D